MRVFVEVGREESVTRPSWCMPSSLMARRKLWPGISSPTTPARNTSAPKVQALTATLVAPPGTIRSSLNSRIKIGASRAMRVGLPIRYSSATMSPMTRTRLPLKSLMSERKRELVRPGSDRSSVMILPSPQNHSHCKARQSQHTPPAPWFTIEPVEPFQTQLAPIFLRKLGLEWLYRLYREPWRWRRMLALPRFAMRVILRGRKNHDA